MHHVRIILLLAGILVVHNMKAQISIPSPLTTNGIAFYPTHIDTLGRGGFMAFTYLSERNAIPVGRRSYGMLVYVRATDSIYQLKSEILSDNNWYPLPIGSGTDLNNYYTKHQVDSAKLNINDTTFMLASYLRSIDTSKYLKRDGSVALTADWLIGNHAIQFPELNSTPSAPNSGIKIYSKGDVFGLGYDLPYFMGTDGKEFALGQSVITLTYNASGVTIPAGSPVCINKSLYGVSLAKANNPTTMPVIGVAIDNIPNNSPGRIMITGNITPIDLRAFSTGDVLYVSPTAAGGLTNISPSYPNIIQVVGTVGSNAENGVLGVLLGAPSTASNLSNYYTRHEVDSAKLNINDTALMLSPYIRSSTLGVLVAYSDTAAMVSSYLRKSDTANLVLSYLRRSDTGNLVLPYLRKSDTLSMLSQYSLSFLSEKYSDTASLVAPYLKKSDTSMMLNGYLRSGQVVNYSDTALMLNPYLNKTDTSKYLKRDGSTALTADWLIGLHAIQFPELSSTPSAPNNGIKLYSKVDGFGLGYDLPYFEGTDGKEFALGQSVITPTYNGSGAMIPAGSPVCINKSLYGVSLAKANDPSTMPAIGIAIENISNNSPGRIMLSGNILPIDLRAFNPGDILYVSPTVAGGFTNIPPSYPNIIQVAGVIGSNAENGVLGVLIGAPSTASNFSNYYTKHEVDSAKLNISDTAAMLAPYHVNQSQSQSIASPFTLTASATDTGVINGINTFVNNTGIMKAAGLFGSSITDYGVHGVSESGVGVYGENPNGFGVGIKGISQNGYGVYGIGGPGVTSVGVYGENQYGGNAIYGYAAGSGTAINGYAADGGTGISGNAVTGIGVSAYSATGGIGLSASSDFGLGAVISSQGGTGLQVVNYSRNNNTSLPALLVQAINGGSSAIQVQVDINSGAHFMDFSDNAINAPYMSITSVGMLTNHIMGAGSLVFSPLPNPTFIFGAGAGTNATIIGRGSDLAGANIGITTGSSPSQVSDILDVIFGTQYDQPPSVIIFPANAAAALLTGPTMVYITSSTTGFTIYSGPTPLTASTTYLWNYIVIQP